MATVALLGAALVLVTLGVSGVRGADPETVYPAAHLVALWLLAPLALISLGSGVLQALLTEWGLLRYWWVLIKLVITASMTIVVFAVLLPRLGNVADIATGASPEALTDPQRTTVMLAPTGASILLLLNVVLGIYRPAWRLRSGRP